MEGLDRKRGVATPAVTYRCQHCGTDAPAVQKRRLSLSGRWALILVLALGVVVPGVVLLLLAAQGEWAGLPPFAAAVGIALGGAVLTSALWAIGSWGMETVSTCPHCKKRVR